jgi:hypothetical protein
MMGREKNTSPIDSVMLSRIDRWIMSGKQARYGPSPDNFLLFLDFKHVSADMRPHCNAWNHQAQDVFADDMILSYPDLREHRNMVADCFAVHLKQLQNQFNKFHSATDEDTRAIALKARKIQLRRAVRVQVNVPCVCRCA